MTCSNPGNKFEREPSITLGSSSSQGMQMGGRWLSARRDHKLTGPLRKTPSGQLPSGKVWFCSSPLLQPYQWQTDFLEYLLEARGRKPFSPTSRSYPTQLTPAHNQRQNSLHVRLWPWLLPAGATVTLTARDCFAFLLLLELVAGSSPTSL